MGEGNLKSDWRNFKKKNYKNLKCQEIFGKLEENIQKIRNKLKKK